MVKCTIFKKVNSSIFFNSPPELSFINRYVKLFGLKDIEDKSLFTRFRYDVFEMKDKLLDLLPDLILFVRPFALKTLEFDTDFCYKKCVTFLRYLLNYHNYSLLKYEYMKIISDTLKVVDRDESLNINSRVKKIIYYRIIKIGMDIEEGEDKELGSGYISKKGITIKHNVLLYFD